MYKIMIIEDEQIERETLYKIIQEGFPECQELYAAKNGKEALTLFEEHHPDIILADINIPGINGRGGDSPHSADSGGSGVSDFILL